jgi:hypothetical protein
VDTLVFNTLRAVAQEQDDDRRQLLMAQSNAALGEHFQRHTSDMEEVAYDLLNRAWSDAQTEDIVQRVIEVKTVGLGDPDYVDEDLRGMKAYFQGKGGQILSYVMRYERSQMPREEMATAIDLHRDEIALDFWGTFGKLQDQAREKMSQLPTFRLVELIQAGITAGATFGTFAAATLTSAQIDPIIESVANRSKGNVTLLGSRQATRQLANLGLEFSNELKDQVFRTGQIGVYKGYSVVEVENFEDFGGNLVLPTNELWVVGQNAGRLTYYGNQAKVQQLPRPAFYVRWETARDAGMLLYGVGRGRMGRIVLT